MTVSNVILVVPLLAPLAAGLLAAVAGWRKTVAWSAVGAAVVILGCGILAAVRTGDGSALTAGSLLRADALSSVMLLVIGSVAVIATWAGVTYIEDELMVGHTDALGARLYGVLVPLFLAAMVLAVLASNHEYRREITDALPPSYVFGPAVARANGKDGPRR